MRFQPQHLIWDMLAHPLYSRIEYATATYKMFSLTNARFWLNHRFLCPHQQLPAYFSGISSSINLKYVETVVFNHLVFCFFFLSHSTIFLYSLKISDPIYFYWKDIKSVWKARCLTETCDRFVLCSIMVSHRQAFNLVNVAFGSTFKKNYYELKELSSAPHYSICPEIYLKYMYTKYTYKPIFCVCWLLKSGVTSFGKTNFILSIDDILNIMKEWRKKHTYNTMYAHSFTHSRGEWILKNYLQHWENSSSSVKIGFW